MLNRPHLLRVYELALKELPKFIRYCVIGLAMLGLTIGGYALFSRVLWTNGPHALQYVLVACIVTCINYQINSRVTFVGSKRNAATFARFVMVTISSICLSTFLFWLGETVFHLFDLMVVFVSNVLIAFYTFALHRIVTFRYHAVSLSNGNA